MSPRKISWSNLALISAAVLACGDSAESLGPSAVTRSVIRPSFTVGAGIVSTTLARGNAGPFHVQSNYQGFNVQMKTHDNADVAVASLIAPPGGFSGWHSHPGPAIVTIKAGALTIYDAHDKTCTGKVHSAGSVFIETGGHVHMARNEGAVTAEWVTTYLVPAGGPTRIDEPASGNCPF